MSFCAATCSCLCSPAGSKDNTCRIWCWPFTGSDRHVHGRDSKFVSLMYVPLRITVDERLKYLQSPWVQAWCAASVLGKKWIANQVFSLFLLLLDLFEHHLFPECTNFILGLTSRSVFYCGDNKMVTLLMKTSSEEAWILQVTVWEQLHVLEHSLP